MANSTILIVDDEHANQFLLEGLLQANEYDTLVAENGAECLKILREKQVDLILLDIMMPNMTGIEVLAEINNSETLRQIPVIMVSAKTQTADVEEALNAGAMDYVRKPFDEMELLARVRVGIRIKRNEDLLREMINQRDNFVKIVSHDLRSPFTAIHGFAELLLRGKNLTDDQKESLKYIVESVEYSDEYFNKLLSWTMLDSDDLSLNLSENNLFELINSVFRIFSRKAREKNISLENKADQNQLIHVDKTFFRQVIANLVGNAIKFTEPGGQVSCFSEHTGEDFILYIRDNGVGMPENFTPDTLFTEHSLKSNRGTKGEKGTGIGLLICRKIVDAHNFSLSFQRLDAGGTEFYITNRVNN